MTETTEVTLDDSERSKDLSDRAGEAPEGMDEQAFGDSVDDLEALPGSARRALAALLTNRFITRTGTRAAWAATLVHEPRILSRLADLFLDLVVDRDYDVAFKRQSDKEDVPGMLRRDRPLTREATLLLVHMRQLHAYTDSQDDPDPRSLRDPWAKHGRRFRSHSPGAFRRCARPDLLERASSLRMRG